MYLPYGPVSYNFLKGGKLHFHGSIRALVKTLFTYHDYASDIYTWHIESFFVVSKDLWVLLNSFVDDPGDEVENSVLHMKVILVPSFRA